MLDIIHRIDKYNRVKYVWFDTGIEYQATKDHLDYLEQRYGIKIERVKAIKPIPTTCQEFGQPFLSKFVSETIGRLQKHGFQWQDDTYENLAEQYPKCKSSIAWWTNHRDTTKYGYTMFNINYNKYLKEFLMEHPPTFPISNKCCQYAKKDVGKKYVKDNDCDLSIIGIRKAEGGIRAARYQNCYSNDNDTIHQYRPLFYYTNEDEDMYDKIFGLKHSDCYEEYGMTRTGCAGCPYNRHLEDEMVIMEQYEPKLANAAKNIFTDSYMYTKMYRQYVAECKQKAKLCSQ